ncbi:hypothetical protein [Nonomuraea sp. NPDC049400]|uniref:hypothetical protein n=1 Tax=Nonomuraea sp. NPDC049400 TaxID=3364352 RepID=UPI0037A0EFAF
MFATPLGDRRVSVVARDDLAAVAVRVSATAWSDVAAGVPRRHAGRARTSWRGWTASADTASR